VAKIMDGGARQQKFTFSTDSDTAVEESDLMKKGLRPVDP
jgi:hypothetical protein